MDEDFDPRHFDGRCRLFPLPGVVLFPHAVLPLHIFEPRYRQMTRDAVGGDKLVAIVQVSPDQPWPTEGEPKIEPVACLGRIIRHEVLPDGRFNFLLHGRARVRIVREIEAPTLYRQAEVEVLLDAPPGPDDDDVRDLLARTFRAVADRAGGLDADMGTFLLAAPPLGVMTDLLSQSLALPAGVKQALLAEPRPDERARRLASILEQALGDLGDPPPSRPFPPPFSLN